MTTGVAAQEERTAAVSLGAFAESAHELIRSWSPVGGATRVWWRGQHSSAQPLTPGLYRGLGGTSAGTRLSGEQNALVEFMRLGRAFVATPPEHAMEWYSLARHHGLATRHLDWSESGLVALYFALFPVPECDAEEAAVWALDPAWLNGQTPDLEPRRISEHELRAWDWLPGHVRQEVPQASRERPIAVAPAAIHPRMVAQHSVFTIHGTDSRPMETQALDWATTDAPPRLQLLRVAASSKNRIRDELRLVAGLRAQAVYPDLDGLAAQLNDDYGLV